MPKRKPATCALCGQFRLTTQEHVIPDCLYPASKASSKVQRITIRACESCNNGSSDDDVHFRNVVSLAGEPNEVAREIIDGKFLRSLRYGDGARRARDVFNIMRPAHDVGSNHWRIFPADDPRILCSVRKIVRGLSHHHGIRSAVPDVEVTADVARMPLDPELVREMTVSHAEPDIIEYRYLSDDDFESLWWLRFFGRTDFYAVISPAKIGA